MFEYGGSTEDETKDLVRYYYDKLCFIKGKVHSIEPEYAFSNYSRPDFLIETKDEYFIIECKGKAEDTNIGQILRYMGLLKEEKDKEEKDLKDKTINGILFANKATQHLLTSIDALHNTIQLFTWERLLRFEIDDNYNHHLNALVYLIYSSDDGGHPTQKLSLDFKINEEHPWRYLTQVEEEARVLCSASSIKNLLESLQKKEEWLNEERASFDEKISELKKRSKKRIEDIREDFFRKDEQLSTEREKFHRQIVDHFLQDNISDELRGLLVSIHEERKLLEETAKKMGINYHNSKTLKHFQKSLVKPL